MIWGELAGFLWGMTVQPAARRLEGKQRYRVYWNRAAEAPQVWTIDTGSVGSEINVQWYQIHTSAISRVDLAAEWPEPKGWIEVFGRLRIVAGGAVLE